MKTIIIKDIMVPIEEYATVYENLTLFGAISELERIKLNSDTKKDRHRAILIKRREDDHIIGKISYFDIINALEPKYKLIGNTFTRGGLSRFGFSPKFMESLIENYKLWDDPMEDICYKAGTTKVSEFMYTPTEGEYVNLNDDLSQGVHKMVMGHHHGLLVTEGKKIVGILRLSDVFAEVVRYLKDQCSV